MNVFFSIYRLEFPNVGDCSLHSFPAPWLTLFPQRPRKSLHQTGLNAEAIKDLLEQMAELGLEAVRMKSSQSQFFSQTKSDCIPSLKLETLGVEGEFHVGKVS